MRKNEFRYKLIERLRLAFGQSRTVNFHSHTEEVYREYMLARKGEEILINRYELHLNRYEAGEIENKEFSYYEVGLLCALYVNNEISRKRGYSNIESYGLIPTPFMDKTMDYMEALKIFFQKHIDYAYSLKKIRETEIVAAYYYKLLLKYLDEFEEDNKKAM